MENAQGWPCSARRVDRHCRRELVTHHRQNRRDGSEGRSREFGGRGDLVGHQFAARATTFGRGVRGRGGAYGLRSLSYRGRFRSGDRLLAATATCGGSTRCRPALHRGLLRNRGANCFRLATIPASAPTGRQEQNESTGQSHELDEQRSHGISIVRMPVGSGSEFFTAIGGRQFS